MWPVRRTGVLLVTVLALSSPTHDQHYMRHLKQRCAGDSGAARFVGRDRFPSTIVNMSVSDRGSPYVGLVSCVISASRKPFSLIRSRSTSLKRQSV